MQIDISFDDGQIGDLKAARLLSKYGFKGTFYYPSCPVSGTTQMSLKECYEGIVKLGHEIGGHTVSHPMDMKILEDEDLKFEIENNRYLVSMIFMKKPVYKFCYPRGRHDERVREAVKKAGYTEARTTRVLQIRNDKNDPLQTPTTIQMFPRQEYEGVSWFDMAQKKFNEALNEWRRGDQTVFFSIWGHSNELEKFGDWDTFEYFLRFMREELDRVGLSTTEKGQMGQL